jgi:hypothetical protein
MKPSVVPVFHCVVMAWVLVAGGIARAGSGGDVVVSTRVFNGYERTKLADGTFKPERFAIGKGTHWKSRKIDPSLDGLSFTRIAQTIAGPLRKQGYLPTADPTRTDLLILVSWGVTTGATEGDYDHALPMLRDAMSTGGAGALTAALALQAAENRLRERNNVRNAEILGYSDAYVRAREMRDIGFGTGDSTFWELEANRYFVVLKAYDFPHLRKEKKLKLLWEARFSIYEHRNNFDQQLLGMTQAASRYFGQDTDGLVHRVDVPE